MVGYDLVSFWLFRLGRGANSRLYPAEVTPLRIRAQANALSTASNWIWNFCIVMATGPMFANIKWGTYVVFAVSNGLIILPVV